MAGIGNPSFQAYSGRTQYHLIPYIGNKSGFGHIFDMLIPGSLGGRRIYDVFGGGASFSIYACTKFGSKNVTYNDSNPVVINLIRCVRDDPRGLWSEYEKHRVRSSEPYYLDIRTKSLDDGPEGAGRFLYLAKNAFSGKIRFNLSNKFNAPMRKKSRCPRLDRKKLLHISGAIRHLEITNEPFEHYGNVRDSFLYLDPPHMNDTGSRRSKVPSTEEFTRFVKGTEAHNMIMISEQNRPDGLKLSENYLAYRIHFSRSLQHVTRTDSREIIAINYRPPQRFHGATAVPTAEQFPSGAT